MEKNEKHFLYFLLIVAIGGIIFGYFWHKQLMSNHSMTTAIIKNCYWSGGRSARHFMAHYSYEVNGIVYEDNTPIACEKFTRTILNERLVNKKLPVVYNPDHPSNNSLLTIESDYKKFDMVMPDSLRWLDSFLLCK